MDRIYESKYTSPEEVIWFASVKPHNPATADVFVLPNGSVLVPELTVESVTTFSESSKVPPFSDKQENVEIIRVRDKAIIFILQEYFIE
jgi:hypothetical protein